MQAFFLHVRARMQACPQARDLCQGSTIILGLCALIGVTSAIVLMVEHLASSA
jgi:hypothetical protein